MCGWLAVPHGVCRVRCDAGTRELVHVCSWTSLGFCGCGVDDVGWVPRIQPEDGLSAETCSCFSFSKNIIKVVLRPANLSIYSNVKRLHVCTVSNVDCLVVHHVLCLGALVSLRKVAINFVLSVRLSVHTEHLGCHWTDFLEIWYLRGFRRSV
jgi:hypothetical protein